MQKYTLIFFIFWILFFFLGLPLLSPGALFVLDFVPLPFTHWQTWSSTSLQWHIVDVLNYIFEYSITSKIYFCIVYLVGIFAGIHIGDSLWLILKNTHPHKIFILRITSILFILCNPWTYERMITQPGIALGMFSLVICLSYLIKNIFSSQKYILFKASIAAAFSLLFFQHASFLLLLIGSLYSIFYFKQIEKKYFIIAPLIILFLNANWLIWSIFLKENTSTAIIQTFDRANIEWFIWNSLSGLWSEITHILLYGFWGEKYHILTPEKFNAYWYLFWFIVLGIIIYGNLVLYKKEKKLWWFLSLLTVSSYILALGIASPFSSPVSNFLYEYIPGYIGMREPQKWLWLSMICYAFFFWIAVFSGTEKKTYFPSWLIIATVFTLLNTWNPMNLWAYQGQLLWVSIPENYFTARDFLLTEKKEGKVLVLPWHTYMSCKWTRWKVIATKHEDMFYPLPTIVSDNIEIDTKYTNSSSPVSRDIEKYLQNKDLSILQKQNVVYILMVKNCASEKQFDYLKKETKTYKNIYSNPDIDIYSIYYETNK